MLQWLLLTALLLLAALAGVILCSPLHAVLSCASRDGHWRACAECSWMHRAMLSLRYTLPGGKVERTVLWRTRTLGDASSAPTEGTYQREVAPAAPLPPPREPQAAARTLLPGEDDTDGNSTQAIPQEAPAEPGPGIIQRLRTSRLAYFLRQREWRRKALHSLRAMARALPAVVRLDRLRLDVSAHLSDPARLGALAGYVNAAGWALSAGRPSRIHVSFEPLFGRPGFRADAELALHTSLARMLWPVLILAVTFPYVTTLRAYLGARRRFKPSVGGVRA
jgi:hypothetical protein